MFRNRFYSEPSEFLVWWNDPSSFHKTSTTLTEKPRNKLSLQNYPRPSFPETINSLNIGRGGGYSTLSIPVLVPDGK